MKNKKYISIVVPLHDEAWCVAPLYRKLKNLAIKSPEFRFEFVFVNDGSGDETAERLDALAEEDATVKVIHLRRNFGISHALRAGFDHASGEVVVTMDGSLQSDPADISALLEKIEAGYDVCSGWRDDSEAGHLKRSVPSRLFNRLVSYISGVRLHDYECLLKAYRREVIHGIELYGELYRFIPVYAYWRGARIAEIPVTQHPRAHGYKKHENQAKRGLKIIFDLILLKFLSRYAQRPLYIFGIAGIGSFFISILAFALMLYYKFFGDKTFIETPLPLIVVFGVLAGGMLILIGVLAEFIIRIYYATRNEPLYVVKSLRNL